MAQELVAHPRTGKPAVKVIHFTEEGEKIDWEERTLNFLQNAHDQAQEEYTVEKERNEEIRRQAEKMIREADEKLKTAEVRLEDCKSELDRGRAITADPGAYTGAKTTSRPRAVPNAQTAGSGFGFSH